MINGYKQKTHREQNLTIYGKNIKSCIGLKENCDVSHIQIDIIELVVIFDL